MTKSCYNCRNCMMDGQPCFGYECVENEDDAIRTAERCNEWEPEGPDDKVMGVDYGPGNPWDAPGMSISDFISGVIIE